MLKHIPIMLCAFLLLLPPTGSSQWASRWSVPVRITTSGADEVHPVFADGFGWLRDQEELLAFSRNRKNICLLRTTNAGAGWSDSVVCITTDSADNDFPSLVRGSYSPSVQAMLLWQGRRNGNLEILYSRLLQDNWSPPQQLTNDTADDVMPHIAAWEGTYYCAWERNGRIMFSEYIANAWSAPRSISDANDTTCHLPQVTVEFIDPPAAYTPVVVWEKRRRGSRSRVVMVSLRAGSTWTTPDTLVGDGDNRRPRFFKYGQQHVLTWDRVVDARFRTYAGYTSISAGRIGIGSIAPLNSAVDTSQNASVNGFLIIVSSTPTYYYSASTWEVTGNDSIGVSLIPNMPDGLQRLRPAGASINRNPTISQGSPAIQFGFAVRFWAVWEAFVANRWQLFCSNAVLMIRNVGGSNALPEGFALYQNSPNPITANRGDRTTHIRFTVGRSAFGDRGAPFVTLKVFDVLGREVATLVNGTVGVGDHSVTLDAGSLPSGVYYYQLAAPNFIGTRKMMVVR
ncbi:MAG: hypothetical protein C4326_15290 [Ignavibacteria bacterium]